MSKLHSSAELKARVEKLEAVLVEGLIGGSKWHKGKKRRPGSGPETDDPKVMEQVQKINEQIEKLEEQKRKLRGN